MHTPRFWGLEARAGLEVLYRWLRRPNRTSWLKVGILYPNPQTSPRRPFDPPSHSLKRNLDPNLASIRGKLKYRQDEILAGIALIGRGPRHPRQRRVFGSTSLR